MASAQPRRVPQPKQRCACGAVAPRSQLLASAHTHTHQRRRCCTRRRGQGTGCALSRVSLRWEWPRSRRRSTRGTRTCRRTCRGVAGREGSNQHAANRQRVCRAFEQCQNCPGPAGQACVYTAQENLRETASGRQQLTPRILGPQRRRAQVAAGRSCGGPGRAWALARRRAAGVLCIARVPRGLHQASLQYTATSGGTHTQHAPPSHPPSPASLVHVCIQVDAPAAQHRVGCIRIAVEVCRRRGRQLRSAVRSGRLRAAAKRGKQQARRLRRASAATEVDAERSSQLAVWLQEPGC